MQTINIETAQNVDIEYEVASIGDRVVAALIDVLIMVGYMIAITILLSLLSTLVNPVESGFGIALWIVFYLPIFFYDLLCETFLDGQSFGKRLRKIKVVKIDGTQPGIGSYFLRWLIKPADVYFTYGSIGVITIFINGKGQRLGDIAANTTVIKMKSYMGLENTILSNIPDNYQLKFPQVSALTDREMRIIKDVIVINNARIDPLLYERLLEKTKHAISQKIGVASDMHPIYFLNTILKDYNHLNRE
jgi:uncharacterized RDD family membrane protein YckC